MLCARGVVSVHTALHIEIQKVIIESLLIEDSRKYYTVLRPCQGLAALRLRKPRIRTRRLYACMHTRGDVYTWSRVSSRSVEQRAKLLRSVRTRLYRARSEPEN